MDSTIHTLLDVVRNTVLITGLVIVMMMLIESLNIESKGLLFSGLRKTKKGQVLFSALLGSIPGCMGGFASVSLYTHRMISFGALVAMMIASSGDEAFMIIAMVPEKAMMIFSILFCIAVCAGILTDIIHDRLHSEKCHKEEHSECGDRMMCDQKFEIHSDDGKKDTRRWTPKRIAMLLGVTIFIGALVSGILDHNHPSADETCHIHECTENPHTDGSGHEIRINLLDEKWMQYLFAVLSVAVLAALLFSSDHFVEEHLWKHIVRKHLPGILAWTGGILLVVSFGMQYFDVGHWITGNTVLMILLAAIIGIIPESGPHMIFVTLYAGGIVPLSVLLTSSISQDGHSSIPLIAESKKSFAKAKLINVAVAVITGFVCMALGF